MAETKIVVAIPIFNGFTALDIIGPYEVLHRLPGVRVVLVSETPGLYHADDGHLKLQAESSFEEVPNPDVLVVPGGPVPNLPLGNQVFLDYIRKAHETTTLTVSVCTGALFLGAAGLLTGLEAATHWGVYEKLASYGAIPVNKRYLRQGKIFTAAGVSAGIDASLEIASVLSSEKVAKAVQLLIEYDPEPPFDAGHPAKAGDEIVSLARKIAARSF